MYIYNIPLQIKLSVTAIKNLIWRLLGQTHRLAAVTFILVTIVYTAPVCAQTNTWTGTIDNDWHKPCNWSLNAVPTCGDSVVIPAATIYPVITDTAQSHVISITSPDPNTLTVNSTAGGVLYVSSTNGGICAGTPAVHQLSAPVVGAITQPTCGAATGSVALSGLPSTGTWTVTGNPSGSLTGTGTTGTVTGLAAGTTYTFTVSNGGCSSAVSNPVIINTQPTNPSAPVVGTISQPTCSVATASVALSGLPASGSWTITGSPSGSLTGSGTTGTVTGLTAGLTYTFTVSSTGCTSAASTSAVVNAAPATPAAPTASITQPTCAVGTGTITITTQTGVTYSVDGSTYQVSNAFSGLAAGTYTIYVQSTSAGNCVASTVNQVINAASALSAPVVGTITQPTCTVATGSVDLSGLPASGSWTVTGSPSGSLTGTGTTGIVTGLTAGATYTFVVAEGSCTSTSSGSAMVNAQPVGTSGSLTFNYMGVVQHFTVSTNECATTLSIDMRGAQGGSSLHNTSSTVSRSVGGSGGRVECTSCITVMPGQVLDVYVGGVGGNATAAWPNTVVKGTAGYNGGGTGGAIGIYFGGGGGGGASDIRPTGGSLSTRLAVAGGGGGGGIYVGGTNTDEGGPGGGTTGGTGFAGNSQTMMECGKGGTQAAGGAPGTDNAGYGGCAQAYGALGTGGRACEMTGDVDTPCPVGASVVCQDDPAGGGGGGYYGGGAASNAGGGGGSSLAPSGATNTQGFQTGNGQVIISWP